MEELDKILEYIKIKPRTRVEVKEHFNFNSEVAYRRLRFLTKCGNLEAIELNTSRIGRVFIYKTKGDKNER